MVVLNSACLFCHLTKGGTSKTTPGRQSSIFGLPHQHHYTSGIFTRLLFSCRRCNRTRRCIRPFQRSLCRSAWPSMSHSHSHSRSHNPSRLTNHSVYHTPYPIPKLGTNQYPPVKFTLGTEPTTRYRWVGYNVGVVDCYHTERNAVMTEASHAMFFK